MIHGMALHGILRIIGVGIAIGDHHGIPAIIHVTLIITTITPDRQLIVQPLRVPIDQLVPDKPIMHPGIDPAIEVKDRPIGHLRVGDRLRMAHQCQVESVRQVAVMPAFRRGKITQAIIEALTIARQAAVKTEEAHIAHREAVVVVAAFQVEAVVAVAEVAVVVDVIDILSAEDIAI